MYYENKRSFYIKQYGPAAAIILVAITLIVVAVIFGIQKENKTQVAKEPNTNIISSDPYKLSDEAFEAKVISVNGTVVTVETDKRSYDINLIGIMENKKYSDLEAEIKSDLVGQTVMVDFDTAKTVNGKTCGYIYINNVFYNAKLLENGLAELAPERVNVNKLDVLLAAQLNAKHDAKGIWSY